MPHLRVKNFEQYQHYKTRNPPWIKYYRAILGDYALRQCPIASRLAFDYLLVLAAETDNHIPHDCKYLTERFGFKVSELVLTPLITEGLVLAYGARRVLADDASASPLPNLNLNSPNPNLKIQSNGHAIKKPIPFPEEFVLCEEITSNWASHGIDPSIEFAKFRDHHRARGTLFTDWKAAWRNWARNAIKFKEERHVRPMR